MILFDFYGYRVSVESENDQVLENLKRDFSYFLTENNSDTQLKIVIKMHKFKYESLPNLKAVKQTKNSIIYKDGKVHYFDYYGEAFVQAYDNSAYVYGECLESIHEIVYLLILSKSGKALDLKGLHKVHAFGVSKNGINLLCMMPMKGGKTTTFVNLIKDPAIEIISDDTPLIDRKGKVFSFPVRIGANEKDLFDFVAEDKIYHFKRKEFGDKFLLPLDSVPNKIYKNGKNEKTILLVGVRTTHKTPFLFKISKYRMLKELLEHMVAGIGLPMVVEFFFKHSIADYPFLFKMGLSRLIAAVRLCRKSECYELFLSNEKSKNAEMISDHFFGNK